ncbi:SOS response-associated peptidase family protein [Reinekea blandensis]|uniref:Abasic site processing protein n=1 Tax=Reinekea blandensis MED297 TaxID=314283 RepID=A4BCA1_9GAMM|nr:SOS response-associated peptidase family protein [Reinekea blandensis]EAR10167.1 hypothetical protein MED297_13127 [Reinekea sp. MED297] [Reinekea blandensis MED297]
MCGFIYNVNDFPLLEPLLDIAGYDEAEIRDIIRNRYLRPTDTVINLIPSRTGPRLLGATWWLATRADGSIDNRYNTFNAKAGKLTTSPMHTQHPRSIRSVVPAQGFCEWQPVYKGGRLYSQLPGQPKPSALPKPERKIQHLITQPDEGLMLLAAVSKLRLDEQGNPKVNTAVITLPPHQAFQDVHHKSFPLVLRPEELTRWLDPKQPWSEFDDLLNLDWFRDAFIARPVDAQCQPINNEFLKFEPDVE